MTGYGQAEDYQRARAAGFNGHLVKPVDLGALERAVVGEVAGGKDIEPSHQGVSEPSGAHTTTVP